MKRIVRCSQFQHGPMGVRCYHFNTVLVRLQNSFSMTYLRLEKLTALGTNDVPTNSTVMFANDPKREGLSPAHSARRRRVIPLPCHHSRLILAAAFLLSAARSTIDQCRQCREERCRLGRKSVFRQVVPRPWRTPEKQELSRASPVSPCTRAQTSGRVYVQVIDTSTA